MATSLVDTYESRTHKAIKEYQGDLAVGDNTIVTPAAGNRIFLVGFSFNEGTGVTLVLKSAATPNKSHTFEFSANTAVIFRPAPGFIWATKPGDALIINASAIVTSINIHVIEDTDLKSPNFY